MRCTVLTRGKRGESRALFQSVKLHSARFFSPCKYRYRYRRGVGRDAGGARAAAVRPSDNRMSGLIGRLISHLAQKYIVEALGSKRALSEP